MGALSNFLGSPKEVEIAGIKVTLNPLTVADFKKFAKQNPTEEEIDQMNKDMIMSSVADTTVEEINQMPLDIFLLLVDEINKLNGFTDERADKLKQAVSSK